MAGVAGSALYIFFVAIDLPLGATFMLLLPTVVVYWLAFYLGMSTPSAAAAGFKVVCTLCPWHGKQWRLT